MDEEDLAVLGESQIMSGVKDQQQRDVFAGTSQAEPLTYVRPSMNISKVIFASDGEDSDDEEAVEGDRGGQEKKDEATVSTLPRQLEEKPMKDSDMDAKAVPIPHLQVLDAVGQQQQQVSYEPRSSERSRAESVDMTTFKPVFVPRAERETQTGKDKRDGSREGQQEEGQGDRVVRGRRRRRRRGLGDRAASCYGGSGQGQSAQKEEVSEGRRRRVERRRRDARRAARRMWGEGTAAGRGQICLYRRRRTTATTTAAFGQGGVADRSTDRAEYVVEC